MAVDQYQRRKNQHCTSPGRVIHHHLLVLPHTHKKTASDPVYRSKNQFTGNKKGPRNMLNVSHGYSQHNPDYGRLPSKRHAFLNKNSKEKEKGRKANLYI